MDRHADYSIGYRLSVLSHSQIRKKIEKIIMKDPIIQLTGLTKNYGTAVAVDKLDLNIYKGEIFGLLGPNGAGKTTSILMMLGLTEPSSGTAMVCGYNATRNPIAVKKKVGYLPDNVGFYPDMTALENL